MSEMNADMKSQVSSLTLQAIEGTLSDADFARLEQLLENHDMCDVYVETALYFTYFMRNSANILRQEEEDLEETCSFCSDTWKAIAEHEMQAPSIDIEKPEESLPKISSIPAKPVRKVSKWSVFTAITSAAALILMALLVKYAPEQTSSPICVVNRMVDAEWASVNSSIHEGDKLYAGPMTLLKGAAEIYFSSGAEMLVEGPATFQLESENQIYLLSGSLVVDINNSIKKRFIVRTPSASVVDFGTEFGVRIQNGHTQTYVFDGIVEMRTGSDPLKYQQALQLESGQGAVSAEKGTLVQVPFKKGQFIRKRQFEDWNLAAKGNAYYRWKTYNYNLNRDSSLVAHYIVEDEGQNGQLINSSSYQNDVPNGVLGGHGFNSPTRATGRWPQTEALSFDRNQNQAVYIPSHPALDIAGELTLSTWIKPSVNDDGTYWGGIILSCKDRNEVPTVNFTLALRNGREPVDLDKQRIRLIRREYGELIKTGHVESDFITIGRDCWHLVSVTHNNHEVKFYLDGVLVSTKEQTFAADPAIADLIVGNTLDNLNESERFHGEIDEIAIFNRILSDSEIQDMYQIGNPNSQNVHVVK